MNDRDKGIAILGIYQKLSIVPSVGAMLSYYSAKYPSFDFVANIGKMAYSLNRGKLTIEMQKMASEYGSVPPPRAAWNQAIFETGGYIDSGEIVKEALADTVDDVKNAAKVGVGIYILIAAIPLLVIFFGPKKSAA